MGFSIIILNQDIFNLSVKFPNFDAKVVKKTYSNAKQPLKVFLLNYPLSTELLERNVTKVVFDISSLLKLMISFCQKHFQIVTSPK